MADEDDTGLIDVSDRDLADLKQLDNPALLRAMRHIAKSSGTVAGFQSAV
ncbi:hypothetical protein ACIBEJ_24665 [Nonomuraea sp. NPDC050790]